MDTKGKLHDDANLNLACIGNCAYTALIDQKAQVVWSCYPRFDGDPIFCSLLKRSTSGTNDIGFWDILVSNFDRSEQCYLKNSAVLSTKLYDKHGSCLEIIDCIPRFESFEREYRPNMLIRTIKPIKGRPRCQIRLRPTFGYGWGVPEKTRGSNHIRYLLSNMTIRLTTNAPISYVVDEAVFEVDETIYLCLMPDESLKVPLNEMSVTYLDKTLNYWRNWVKTLTIPFEWQDQVIRSVITLKMANFEETGAIVSAMTTSIPNRPDGGNHDYRYCWLREAQSIVHTLRLIGATGTMEGYLRFLSNVVADFTENNQIPIQPVFGISLEKRMHEREMHRLPGYRGIGPVKLGSMDPELLQNDVYGAVILSLIPVFFDKRLKVTGDAILFKQMEGLGEYARQVYNLPDAGPRGITEGNHTFSAVMCWVACDRLARIAELMEDKGRSKYWCSVATEMKNAIIEQAFNKNLNSFVSVWGTEKIDSYLLLLPELKFIDAKDPRFLGTLERVEKSLVKNGFVCAHPDDKVSLNAATFDYIHVLALAGRKDEARKLFENMLANLNSNGMLSETIDPQTRQHWGNFPQNSATVGLITCAMKLSKDWDEAY
eukprot:TRINITY_DN2248_c0_g1_i2.p1 TRINITY_DN2248_c0_g1~~TRINITY_DN2248_c0_g1_i2.p1  ORF type:complete len:600 (+),score=162.30 TRINITY_DN2248_c0_g1_i2:141-1940(+)